MSSPIVQQTLAAASSHHEAGRLDKAERLYQKVLKQEPNNAMALHGLGFLYLNQGKAKQSAPLMERATMLRPWVPEFHNNLGLAYRHLEENEKALACYQQAVKLRPNYAMSHYNIGIVNQHTGRLAEAEREYRLAIQYQPSLATVYNNLGNLLKDQGRTSEAIEAYRRAIAHSPHESGWYSNLLLANNYLPRSDNGLLAEHIEWAQRTVSRFYPSQLRFSHDRSRDRRLRLGYVSPDFREHAVASFFEPILFAHDRTVVEIFCYSNVSKVDHVTQRMRDRAEQWREIWNQEDEAVVQKIRNDRIDILVDLAGHTAGNRLPIFARKPAPVQVTYLGYPNTTGLQTMDWRLTDTESDPPGMTDAHYTEKLFRLPQGFLCYQAMQESPLPRSFEPASDPCVTFGSFNNFAKVSIDMLQLWARLLLAVPNSRLLMKADTFGNEELQKRVRDAMGQSGVDPERVELIGRRPSFADHLKTYDRVDIGLDTFPYHGTTTTCEAMWMGVPVITLAGQAHVSRVGVSLLTRVGRSELIAHSPDQYMSIAAELARDAPRRRQIASGLRERMRASPLMNASGFVRQLEAAYRSMWQQWCQAS